MLNIPRTFTATVLYNRDFWKAFTSWLTKQNMSLAALTLVNILFGVFNENEDNIILNHLILMAK